MLTKPTEQQKPVPSSHFLSEFASHMTPDGYEHEVVYKCIHCKKRCYYGEMLAGHTCKEYAQFKGFKLQRQML